SVVGTVNTFTWAVVFCSNSRNHPSNLLSAPPLTIFARSTTCVPGSRTVSAAAVLIAALANPSLRREDREPLNDVAFVVVDETASQTIDGRPAQVEAALRSVRGQLDPMAVSETAPLEYRVVTVRDGIGQDADRGTRLLSALSEAAAGEPADRIAGAIVISDGQIHDAGALKGFPAPVHLLLTGRADEWDRRLVIETAPTFAIVGEPVSLSLRIEAVGKAPEAAVGLVPLHITINGNAPQAFRLPAGQTVSVPLDIAHGGINVVQVSLPPAPGELTERNNTAVFSVNGVRDRLRVLLVSGEPYAGERTWRNLLKADPSVDLVHFTILRPPTKQDGVPVFELSLIAFPTRELFMDKVDEFDLIIFDRYRRRGVLPSLYLENVVDYVRKGGAVLVASGPAFAGAESLFRTPLQDVLPVMPTANILEEGYLPRISPVGRRHPVTERLEDIAPRPASGGEPGWGRWFRLIDATQVGGNTIMRGPDDRPLLVLDRPGDGRIAMLLSDHAWLWSRGYEGGGPQSELLRRLAHWLMKEPELEEEALIAETDGANVTVTRRTLGEVAGDITVTSPDDETSVLALTEVSPGRWQAQFAAPESGIYQITDGTLKSVAAVGTAAPREFENPVSSFAPLAPLIDATKGGKLRLESVRNPTVRRVREGRVSAGRNWIGLTRRGAYVVRDIRLTSLAPGWLLLVLSAALIVGAWRLEGR
ncbi:MAG: hypothetical protein ACE5FS_13745, partial [Paracoccaceae bacterium]